MKSNTLFLAAISMALCAASESATAYEFGAPGYEQKPGVLLGGASAGTPPPGIYMFEQFGTDQASIVGPAAPNVNGSPTPVRLTTETTGILFVPGWTFLGAQYDAVIVQPAATVAVGAPISSNSLGLHNTALVPGELSWKLGDSGFFVKTGFGVSVPDGSISGPAGLSSSGHPWWTFLPTQTFSYLKDGWNVTASFVEELNTKNSFTGYTSGDVLHGEFSATKKIGKWTIGPVADYYGQVSDDTSSAYYHYAINVNRYNVWAAGALVGYDFGPVALNVWATSDISANASGVTPTSGSITKGYNIFASASFRIWAPEESEAPKKLVFK